MTTTATTSFTSLLTNQDAPDVVWPFLSGKDVLKLAVCNQQLNKFTNAHSDAILGRCLHQDYAEGWLVWDAFMKRNRKFLQHLPLHSAKNIYLAFLHRWKVSQEKEKYVAIHWQYPPDETVEDEEEETVLAAQNTGDSASNEMVAGAADNGEGENEDSAGDAQQQEDCKSYSEEIEEDFGGDLYKYCDHYNTECGDINTHALQFIVRICRHNEKEACGFLAWEKGDDNQDQLVMDDTWKEAMNATEDYWPSIEDMPFDLCKLIDEFAERGNRIYEEGEEGTHGSDNGESVVEPSREGPTHKKRKTFFLAQEIDRRLWEIYRLTVHAVDVEACQVMTLMDFCPAFWTNKIVGLDTPELAGYGFHLPKFLGLPPKGSPLYHDFTPCELRSLTTLEADWTGVYTRHVESLHLLGSLHLGRCYEHEPPTYADGVYLHGVEFKTDDDFSSLNKRGSICNYLRALLKEKCHLMPEVAQRLEQQKMQQLTQAQAVAVEQPQWVGDDKIVGRIASFATFKEKASILRLVSKAFKSTVMAQLEDLLLDQTSLPIAFERFDPSSHFRADACRGWHKGFSSREEVVNEAIWMLSCRCSSDCEDFAACPGMESAPAIREKGESRTIDIAEVRGTLMQEDTYEDPQIDVSFTEWPS